MSNWESSGPFNQIVLTQSLRVSERIHWEWRRSELVLIFQEQGMKKVAVVTTGG